LRAVVLLGLAVFAVGACSGSNERVRISRVETDIVDFERSFAVAGDVLVGVRWRERAEHDEQVVTSTDGRRWAPVELPGVDTLPVALRWPYEREGQVAVNGEIVEPGSRGAFDPDFTTWVWTTRDGQRWSRTACPRVLGCAPPSFFDRRYQREDVSLDGGRTTVDHARFGDVLRLDSGDRFATAAVPIHTEAERGYLLRSNDGRTWHSVVRDRCGALTADPTGRFHEPVRLGDHWLVVHTCSVYSEPVESAIYLGDANATTFRTISRSPHELGQPLVVGNRVFVPEQAGLETHFVVVEVE
jgi:hypothetical protein